MPRRQADFNTAILCAIFSGLLSIGAVLTGLGSSLSKAGRPRGTYLGIAITAMALGAFTGLICLVLIFVSIGPHAIDPKYLHPC